MQFNAQDLHDQLLAASDVTLQSLDFGVIGMGDTHRVVFYNDAEAAAAGLSAERVLGRHFFTEVAPCTNNFMVAQRFEGEPTFDATIAYVFTLRMRPTPVALRLLQREGAARQFLLVQRG